MRETVSEIRWTDRKTANPTSSFPVLRYTRMDTRIRHMIGTALEMLYNAMLYVFMLFKIYFLTCPYNSPFLPF